MSAASPAQRSGQRRARGPFTRWLRRSRGGQGRWVLADQAVVSGSNFLIGILLARQLGPEAFGTYVLLQAVMLYVNSYQGALIFQPLLSTAPQLPEAPRRRYLEGAYALQLLLAGALAALTLLIGLLVALITASVPGLPRFSPGGLVAIPALALALCAFQMLDWQRRILFVNARSHQALGLDLCAYGLQGGLLLALAALDLLSVATAFFAIASGCAVAWLMFGKPLAWLGKGAATLHGDGIDPSPAALLRPVWDHAREVLARSWRNSRDYLAAWQFQWVGSQGVLVVGAGLIGAHAAGGVRAAQNIIGPVNLLFQAMENVVPINAARRYAAGGLPGLSAYLWRTTAAGSVLLLPLLGALALWSLPLTRVLYGERYAAYASLVMWQALSIFLQFYLRQGFFFLRTVGATGAVLGAGVVMACVAVGVALATVRSLQASGVMFAFLAGYAAALFWTAVAVARAANAAKAAKAKNAKNAKNATTTGREAG